MSEDKMVHVYFYGANLPGCLYDTGPYWVRTKKDLLAGMADMARDYREGGWKVTGSAEWGYEAYPDGASEYTLPYLINWGEDWVTQEEWDQYEEYGPIN